MKGKSNTVENKWKKVAILFIVLFIVFSVISGFLFMKTSYPSRIATKMGIGGYSPSGRESYLIESWSGALDDFDTDVVFLGDSITYGGDWEEYFPELSVCKLAVPGESIEQILYRADMIEKLQPQKVFVLAGVNNISRGHYEDTIKKNYSLLLQELSEMNCEIYVQSILPVRTPSEVDNSRIDIANEIIEGLANDYGCVYIDIHTAFLDENSEMKEELTKDGIHLNENGYAVWIEQIESYVQD